MDIIEDKLLRLELDINLVKDVISLLEGKQGNSKHINYYKLYLEQNMYEYERLRIRR